MSDKTLKQLKRMQISEEVIELGEGTISKSNLGISTKSVSLLKPILKDIKIEDTSVSESFNPSKIDKNVGINTKTKISTEAGPSQSSNRALDEKNPNLLYMHRVAYLRACINFMLISVDKSPIEFEGAPMTLSQLLTIYNQLVPDDETIVL